MTQTITPTAAPGLDRATALELRGLTRTFATPAGPVEAVRGIDLTIDRGEVVALLGPNGAGKTTTIDMLLGLSTPTSGTVRVLGAEPAQAVHAGRISAVMQTGGFLGDLTVAETVRLVASLHRSPRPVDEVMERAGLTDFVSRRVAKCSGGQQQRLRFALALLPDPDLIVLDEPTTGMDVQGRRDFWAAMRADSSAGRTVIFATHYLEEADLYADRIVMMSHGRVVADGSAASIKALASGRTVAATLPADELGLAESLPGVTGVERRGERVLLRTQDSDAVLRVLLARTSARDVEVTAHNLEDAFVALTHD